MDFVSGDLFNGRRIRSLTVVDNFSRECLGIWVDQSIKSEDAVKFMRRISWNRGVPERVFLDNGPEFIGKALDKWAYENKVTLDFSRPGKPTPDTYFTTIQDAFRRVVKKAGLDPKQVTPHTLRHTAITHLVQAGVDLPTVKRISGHKTLIMVERYSHQNGEHSESAMDKLESRCKAI